MSRIEEIDKIVDEIGDADSLYEFAECVYEDRQRIAELEEQLKEKTKTIQGLVEAQKHLEESCSYQMFLDIQKQLEEKEKDNQ